MASVADGVHFSVVPRNGFVQQVQTKVRHIDVNVLWLQESCAKKLVPLVKVLGTANNADLMTKHLGWTDSLKHCDAMKLEFREGRAGKAAQLHSMTSPPVRTGLDRLPPSPLMRDGPKPVSTFGTASRAGDDWSHRGEEGIWRRVHVKPRNEPFFPWHASKGPGRKTRLTHMRCTEGVHSMGEQSENFELIDDWNVPSDCLGEKKHWIGSTTFYVDRVPTPERHRRRGSNVGFSPVTRKPSVLATRTSRGVSMSGMPEAVPIGPPQVSYGIWPTEEVTWAK